MYILIRPLVYGLVRPLKNKNRKKKKKHMILVQSTPPNEGRSFTQQYPHNTHKNK